MNKTAAMLAGLAKLGYQEEDTGGGCRALALEVGQSNGTNLRMMITANDGASVPDWGDEIILGIYETDEDMMAKDDGDIFTFLPITDGDTYALALGDHPWVLMPRRVFDVLKVLQEVVAATKARPITLTVDARHLENAVWALERAAADLAGERSAERFQASAKALQACLRPEHNPADI